MTSLVLFSLLVIASSPVTRSPARIAQEELKPDQPCVAFPIDIRDNWVLADELYLALVDLPCDARPDQSAALEISKVLRDFLVRAGYELASVIAEPKDGGLLVRVNEGRLERVVFRGQLTVQSLRFKLALNLPHDVFNRPQLERELRELAKALGMPEPKFELVASAEVEHTSPQVENLGTIRGHALVQPRQPYELHIHFEHSEWTTGMGLDLRSGYFDGLELGVNYQGRSLFFPSDRFRLAASGGLGLREDIRDSRYYPAPSRAFAEMRWYAPPFAERLARPVVFLRAEGIARQRGDLGLENYYNAAAEASLQLQYQPLQGMTFGLGGGMQYRYLFGFEPPRGEVLRTQLAESVRLRSFASGRFELLFDDGGLRFDRRHALVAEGRHFFAITQPIYGEGRVVYQNVIPNGWHDLWLRARGAWLWGEVLLHNEEPLGAYVRGVFGDQYVRRVASGTAEFRFSITRDLYKASLFVDVASYGALDRVSNTEEFRTAVSAGPGLHALIEGMFQLDVYFAFGLASNREFDTGLMAMLLKVF